MKSLSKRPIWVQRMHEYLEKRPDRSAPLRQLTEHAMRFVPAGPAWREGIAKRQTDARYRGTRAEDLDSSDKHRVVRTGSKRIVLKAIHYEVKSRRMEKFDQSGRTWVRLTQEETLDKRSET
jgi:hypothetical protein